MKKLLIVMLLAAMFSNCQDFQEPESQVENENTVVTRAEVSDDYYYGSEGKIPIVKSSDKAYVLYKIDANVEKPLESEKITEEINEIQDYKLITPSTYTASGTTGSNLNISFNNPGIYNLTAQFRTPNNNIIDSPPKAVSVPEVAPIVSVEFVSMTNNQGDPVRFIAYNPNQTPFYRYKWRINGNEAANPSNIFDTTLRFDPRNKMVVECMVYVNEVGSNWSFPYIIHGH